MRLPWFRSSDRIIRETAEDMGSVYASLASMYSVPYTPEERHAHALAQELQDIYPDRDYLDLYNEARESLRSEP